MIPILAVIGTSKSGKTTLMEFIISHLSRKGLNVGAGKHVHHSGFSFDTKEKDTWRFSQSGAKVVVCVAPEETAIVKKESSQNRLDGLLDLVRDEKLDLLILEGFHSLIAKRKDVYKIIVAKNGEDVRRTLEGTVDPILAITVPFAKKKEVSSRAGIPLLDLENNGEEILNLVKGIV